VAEPTPTPTPTSNPQSPKTASARAAARPAASARPAAGSPAKAQWTSSWRRLPALSNQPATFVGVVGLVVLIVAGLIGYGYWSSYIQPGREAAVKVGGQTYDMTYFSRRMKAVLNDPISGGITPQQVAALPERLARDIIDEEVILRRAPTLGIGVSDAEIDKTLAEKLALAYTPDENGNVMATPAFASAVRSALQRNGLTLAELRRAAHAQRLRSALMQHFQGQIPKEMPAVRVRQLAVSDEAKAKELKQQIDGGADFAQIASSVSEDGLTKEQGGLRDWTPKGFLPDEFEKLAYTLPIGQVSEPFQSSGKWVLLRVEEREDNREVSDQDREKLASERMEAWLEEQRLELNARHYLDQRDRQNYALEHSDALEALAARGSQRTVFPGGNP
jgi:parvulin-like peptidyl-prolyl isomerase